MAPSLLPRSISPYTFLMVGVHYTTATLDIRERFSFQPDEITETICALTQQPEQTGIQSLVILTTCNRVELYALCDNIYHAEASIKQYFIEQKEIPSAVLRSDAMHIHRELDVARHLYKVSAGLDSLILGEGQILSQVKMALKHAQQGHAVHKALRALFKEAIHVGKRVRHETGIGDRDASVSKAAFAFAQKQEADLLEKNIAIVGGGKMACLILEALNQLLEGEARKRVKILNRSQDRLEELIERFGFEGVTWEAVTPLLDWADVAFVATGAPHLLFFAEHFNGRERPLSLYDISVPRNVCPEVSVQLPHIHVFDIDDLRGISNFDAQKETRLRHRAEAIVTRALHHLPNCLNRIACETELREFRLFVEQLHEQYLAEHPIELAKADEATLHTWSRGFVQRLLHSPSHVINQGNFDASQLILLRQLFSQTPYTRQPLQGEAAAVANFEAAAATATDIEEAKPALSAMLNAGLLPPELEAKLQGHEGRMRGIQRQDSLSAAIHHAKESPQV